MKGSNSIIPLFLTVNVFAVMFLVMNSTFALLLVLLSSLALFASILKMPPAPSVSRLKKTAKKKPATPEVARRPQPAHLHAHG